MGEKAKVVLEEEMVVGEEEKAKVKVECEEERVLWVVVSCKACFQTSWHRNLLANSENTNSGALILHTKIVFSILGMTRWHLHHVLQSLYSHTCGFKLDWT